MMLFSFNVPFVVVGPQLRERIRSFQLWRAVWNGKEVVALISGSPGPAMVWSVLSAGVLLACVF